MQASEFAKLIRRRHINFLDRLGRACGIEPPPGQPKPLPAQPCVNDSGIDADAAREAIRDIIEEGVIDRQLYQPITQHLICEAGGMVPQLARVSHGFGVPVMSAAGFNSTTSKHALAAEIAELAKPVLVWHIGDYDPSGVHVFQSLADDVTAFAEGMDAGRVVFKRLAVTPAQIGELNLETAPAKSTDERNFDIEGEVGGTVQAEAIAPDKLADIVKAALSRHFDFEADAAAQAASDEAAEQLRSEFGLDDD
jgi:hypothetical protein